LKKLTTITLACAFLITLTGCSSAETAATDIAATCEKFETGTALDGIDVAGEFGSVPTAKLKGDAIHAQNIQTKVLHEGSGTTFTGSAMVKLEYLGLNATTGEVFQASQFDGTDAATQFLQPGTKFDICHALSGVKEGSRVVTIFPAMAAHEGQGIADLNVGANDDIIYVFDLAKVYLPYATGEAQQIDTSFPKLTTDENHIPAIEKPSGAAPTEFKLGVTKKGSGAVVKQGQNVTLQYSGFLWSDGSQFDSSWANGQPVQFELSQGKLIDGFIKALDGQTVGSQVIAIIPPEMGYGDQDQGSIPANSTLIFVVDILGTD
jgi:peptidylprolyl isomerase